LLHFYAASYVVVFSTRQIAVMLVQYLCLYHVPLLKITPSIYVGVGARMMDQLKATGFLLIISQTFQKKSSVFVKQAVLCVRIV